MRCSAIFLVVIGLAVAVAAQEKPPPRTRALASVPEGPIPPYVLPSSEDRPDWLALGGDVRSRFETRLGRLRNSPERTELNFGVTRARLFVGIAPRSSPLSFAVELLDARQFGTDFPKTAATVNELDVLQLRANLDLEPVTSFPISIELGRMSFDSVDRRLIARNRFRNTLNAFDGARVHLGRRESGRELELLALWPTQRRTESWDQLDEDRKLFGANGYLSWPSMVLEPYYLYYQSTSMRLARLHTTGIHLFGPLGERFDHDLHAAYQLGSVGENRHRAFALHLELGRSFDAGWVPRLAAWVDYASGDRDPADGTSERFDPLFGAPHPKYGFTDLFNWQNMIDPAVGLTLRPHPKVRLSIAHRFQWLASSKDAWVRAGLIDPEGRSGSFIGQELDVELQWPFLSFMDLNVQYGEFFAGSFVENTGGGTGARVLYVAVTVGT